MLSNDEAIERLHETIGKSAGDADALCLLFEMILHHSDIPDVERLAAAEVVARQAASTGSIRGHSKLASVLLSRSIMLADADKPRSDRMWWEAMEEITFLAANGDEVAATCLLSNLEERADGGDEEAATLLNQVCELLEPEILMKARASIAAYEAA